MILNNETISLTFLMHLLTCGSSQSDLFGAFHHFTSATEEGRCKKEKDLQWTEPKNVVFCAVLNEICVYQKGLADDYILFYSAVPLRMARTRQKGI